MSKFWGSWVAGWHDSGTAGGSFEKKPKKKYLAKFFKVGMMSNKYYVGEPLEIEAEGPKDVIEIIKTQEYRKFVEDLYHEQDPTGDIRFSLTITEVTDEV